MFRREISDKQQGHMPVVVPDPANGFGIKRFRKTEAGINSFVMQGYAKK